MWWVGNLYIQALHNTLYRQSYKIFRRWPTVDCDMSDECNIPPKTLACEEVMVDGELAQGHHLAELRRNGPCTFEINR